MKRCIQTKTGKWR